MGKAGTREPLAIVGVSAIFPGSTDGDGFWRDILAGRDLIETVPPDRWLVDDFYDADMSKPDKTYAKRGAFLGDISFDALGFGVPPSILSATDTAQLLALVVAQRVLDDATRGQFAQMDREKCSIILGVTSAQELLGDMVARLQRPIWVKSLREAGIPEGEVQAACDRITSHYAPWQEATFPGLLGNVVAGRIANRLDLHGTNCVTDAACASTFSALAMAANELWLGDSDLVVTGGVDTMNGIFMQMCFSKTPALSKSGDCRPFSDKADGTLLGEGMAMFALKRLSDAERAGDRVYAVVRGIGTSSDGRSKSVYAPVPEGQARALRRAYEAAGFPASTVELVEAHGTGTRAGDEAEFKGLQIVFGPERDEKQWCALGSVKSQIGHTKAAAGAAGLFKAVLALVHRTLPPTIKVDRPDPRLNVEQSAFYLNTRPRPWVRAGDHPRRAGVSSFGFGGSNFHIAIEEYAGALRAERSRVLPVELVTIAAATASELADRAEALAAVAAGPGGAAWAAWSAQHVPGAGPARLAVLGEDGPKLAAALRSAAARVRARPTDGWVMPDGSAYAVGAEAGKVALLFPGQGSQHVEMGGALARTFDAAVAVWDASRGLGCEVDRLVFPVPGFDDASRALQEQRLTATDQAQPAIGLASAATLAVLRSAGVPFDAVGGHSFGEVAALYAAGVLDLPGLVAVAAKRGALMAEAAKEPGAMTAVKAPVALLTERLAAWDLGVVIANHNDPSQVVLSGATEAVDEVERRLAAEGLEVRRLAVATAFHSPIVAPAATAFSAFLGDVAIGAPTVPVYANGTAAPYEADAGAIRARLGRQLAEPVQFVEMIERMYADGVRTFVEVGPGSVLTGLVERILDGRSFVALSTDRRNKDGVAQVLSTLGRLFVLGLPVDLSAVFAGYRVPVDPATVAPAKMPVAVSGGNLGRPYPPVGGSAALPGPNPERAPKIVETVVEKIVEKVVEKVIEVPVDRIVEVPSEIAAVAPAGDWSSAFVELQRQTADAHSAWQEQMARTHVAFLGTMEAGLAAAAGLPAASRAAAPAWVAPAAPARSVAPAVAAVAPARPVMAAPVAPVASPVAPVAAPVVVKAAPVAAAAPVVAAKPAPVAAPKSAPTTDLRASLLAVVAGKTGYPVEMLTPEMDLEADLGVDSIKRVEILSALRESVPGLPEVDAGAMASLRTLGQIADHLGAGAVPVGVAVATPVAVVAAKAAPTGDLRASLLAVVAGKTGYPVEMLTPEMDLEADLGVDSIKRVEILSALRESVPGLPEVDAGAMASLRTLGQIADHLGAGAVSVAVAVAAPVAAPVAKAAPTADLRSALLAVVAGKTGYPVEMLTPEMDLEADLGVDSIKRVEILSALRESVPGLPEVDAGAMASLRTLGQIADHLGAGAVSVAAPVPAAVSKPAAAPTADLRSALLAVVAGKTGYPVDMLTPEMDLEADLGVDSIKRVEILSALRESVPGLPEVDAGAMASLRTLGQIADHLGAGAVPVAVAVAAPVAAAKSAPTADLRSALLAVVAGKTGYPVDMLTPEMDLEADLGVDSIKRVEILSALRESVPGLPEVDAGAMASLKTLGQIADHLGAGAAPTAAPVAAAAPVAVAKAAPTADLRASLLAVVAGKTGYPVEMLTPEMDLEADLGVDSIKRVEILSALRESMPGLPEVDAGAMASLRTLGQIADHLGAGAVPAVAAAAPVAAIGRAVVRLVPSPAVGLGLPGFGAGEVQVVGAGALASALVVALQARGLSARGVAEVDGAPDGVIVVAAGVDGPGPALGEHLAAFRAAKAVAARRQADGGAFVTVTQLGGDLGMSGLAGVAAWGAGLPGLVKTASLEWPKAACKAIDLDPGFGVEAAAEAVVGELLAGGPAVEVGLKADGSRWTLVATDVPVSGDGQRLGPSDVVVASGGARGVTAAALIALAREARCRFVLLGRTALVDESAATAGVEDDAGLKKALMAEALARGEKPSPAGLGKAADAIRSAREIRATLAAMAAAGSDARYVAVDVMDRARLGAALDEVRAAWGGITALVHGAGVLADRKIADKTEEQVSRVFDTKVGGLAALLDATAGDNLKAMVLFSSVAARGGNPGQCDYAMANEVLNRVAAAQAAARPGCVVKSMGWGPWEAGMVTPALKEHFTSLGVSLIPLAGGAQAFVDEIQRGPVEEIELVLGGANDATALLGSSGGRSLRGSIRVNHATWGVIDDHRVRGEAVVPVVLAAEWMARAACALRPDLKLRELRDLSVLRGVKVPAYDGAGTLLEVRVRQLENGQGSTIQAELAGPDGRLHYQAVVRMEEAAARPARAPAAPPVGPWGDRVIYDGDVVFHGDRFRALTAVDGVGPEGLTGSVVGLTALGWGGDGWRLDPAALDAALQAGLLWTEVVTGGASLPTGFGRLEVLAEGPARGPLRLILARRSTTADRATYDAWLVGEDGLAVAHLADVSHHKLPGSRGADRAPLRPEA